MNIDVVISVIGKILYFFSPLITASIIAYVLCPFTNFFADKLFKKIKKRRIAIILSIFLTVIIFIALLFFIAFLLIPQIIKSAQTLAQNMNSYIDAAKITAVNLQSWLDKHSPVAIDINKLIGSWDSLLQKGLTWLPQSVSAIVSASYKIGTGVINAVIVFIISIYLLVDKDTIIKGLKKMGVK
jgi:predicted PurR-regulated permease PerM